MEGEDKQHARRLLQDAANEDVKKRFAACLHRDFLVCEFARGAGERDLLDYNVLWKKDDHAPAFIDERIRIAIERGQMCIIIMPPVKTESALARLLAELGRGERWQVHVDAESGVAGSRCVHITWSEVGASASVMGFFPGGVMPVTRRAPYTAMAIWAAGAQNVHRKRPGHVLGPGDMPVPDNLTAANYAEMRARIVGRLDSARDHQFEGSIREHVSFCVSESALRAVQLVA